VAYKSGWRRCADLKYAGEKFLLTVTFVGREKIMSYQRWGQRLCASDGAENATTGRELENTLRILGRLAMVIRVVMVFRVIVA
jgi:hypothetical protein